MLQLLKSSLWSFLSLFFRTGSSLLVNKLIAIVYGPNGITLLAHFQNLIALVTTVPDGGVNIGIVRNLAPDTLPQQDYKNYFIAGLLLNLLAYVVAVLFLLAGFTYYFEPFITALQSVSFAGWLCIFLTGLLFLTLNLYLFSVLLARRMLSWYVLSQAFVSVLSVLIVFIFSRKVAVSELLVLFISGQVLSFLFTTGILIYKKLFPAISFQLPPKHIFTTIGKFILMALSMVLFSKLVDFFVRDYAIRHFDLYQTGLWQAVVKLSDNYSLLFTSLLGMVYYPKVASLLPNPEQLKKYVRQVFVILVPVTAVGLSVFYIFREFFMQLFFDENFLPAVYLIDYQVIGDFFKMAGLLLSYIINIQARVKFYIATHAVFAGFYILLVSYFVDSYGLEGFTLAHTFRYGGFFLFHVIYFRKLLF